MNRRTFIKQFVTGAVALAVCPRELFAEKKETVPYLVDVLRSGRIGQYERVVMYTGPNFGRSVAEEMIEIGSILDSLPIPQQPRWIITPNKKRFMHIRRNRGNR